MTSIVFRVACFATLLPGYALAQTPVLATPVPLQAPMLPSPVPLLPSQSPASPSVTVIVPEMRAQQIETLMHDVHRLESELGSIESLARLRAETELARRLDWNGIEQDPAKLADQRVAVARPMSADGTYNSGLASLQRRQYDQAIGYFNRVINEKGARADAATYWKAFAEYKLARANDASASIAMLRRDFPKSRYLGDAGVLEAEIKKMAGQAIDPADLDNDEIKLLAIQGLQRSEQATPLLEGVLAGANSLSVKKRALYVLAVDMDARKQAVLLRYAKGAGTPDLQIEAIRYLASRADRQALVPDLREIYKSTSDDAVKRAVIDMFRGTSFSIITPSKVEVSTGMGYAMAGASASGGGFGAPSAGVARAQPAPASQGNAAWRATAQQELASLYQQETDNALRAYIVTALGSVGGTAQLQQIISDEATDRAVRLQAIRSYAPDAGVLTALYAQQRDPDTRMAIVASLASQRNADALVTLARKETNREIKTTIVRRLSEMAPTSKVAADYLAEVIK